MENSPGRRRLAVSYYIFAWLCFEQFFVHVHQNFLSKHADLAPLLEKLLRPPMLVLCCLLRAAKLTESKLQEQTIVGKQTRFYLGSWIDTSTCFDKTFSYADAAAARDIRATAEDILHCWALLVRRYEAGLRECARAG